MPKTATKKKAAAKPHPVSKTKRPAKQSAKSATKAKSAPARPSLTTTAKSGSTAAGAPTSRHLGGFHTEANALRNLLNHRGIVDPDTGGPLAESLLIGIGGGVQPGYSFCPSVGRHEMGSGIYIVSLSWMVSTGAQWPTKVLGLLGCTVDVHETGGIKAATSRIAEDLEAGVHPMVFVNHVNMPYLGLDCSIGCQSFRHFVIVYGLDTAAGTVTVGDLAPELITLPLADLNHARERVCSFKNRSLRIAKSPGKLDAAMLKKAVAAGIAEYLELSKKPKMKTFSLEGIEDWAKLIGNATNKRGWLSVFKGGQITRALRDAFLTIETDNSLGGLMRGVYAEFLERAAVVLGKPKLTACAGTYRTLAKRWTELAEDIFPEGWDKTVAESKKLIRQRDGLFRERGTAAFADIQKASKRLGEIEVAWLKQGALVSLAQIKAHMDAISARITGLVAEERAALAQLEASL